MLETKAELLIKRKKIVEKFKVEVAVSNIVHAIDRALQVIGDNNGSGV